MYKTNLLLSFIVVLFCSIGLAEVQKVEQRALHNFRFKHLHDHNTAAAEDNRSADNILAAWLSEIRAPDPEKPSSDPDTPARDESDPGDNEDAPSQSMSENSGINNDSADTPNVEAPLSPAKAPQAAPAQAEPPQPPPSLIVPNNAAQVTENSVPKQGPAEADNAIAPAKAPQAAPAQAELPQPPPSLIVPNNAAQVTENSVPKPGPAEADNAIAPAKAPKAAPAQAELPQPPPSLIVPNNAAQVTENAVPSQGPADADNATDPVNPNDEAGPPSPTDQPSANPASESPSTQPTLPSIPDESSPPASNNVTSPSTSPTEQEDEPKPTDVGTGIPHPSDGRPNNGISNGTSSNTITPTSPGTITNTDPDLVTERPEPTAPASGSNSTSPVDDSTTTTLYGTGYSSSPSGTNLTRTSDSQYSPTGFVSSGTSSSTGDISYTYTTPTITGTGYYPTFTSPSQSNNTATYYPSISSTYSLPFLGTTYAPSASRPVPSNSTQLSTSTPTTTPTIVVPTGTNTASTFMPSSIIAQTLASTASNNEPGPTPTGIPNTLPKIIQNPNSGSTPAQPTDTTEVQIGFEYPLNYPFVVSHPLSTSQIFTYLPIGIADGLGLRTEQVIVKNLLPMDTTADLQYITTVARIYIPSSMVDTLRVDLGIPVSKIYQNEDDSVATLMGYINPAIPFLPGGVINAGLDGNTNSSPSPTGKVQDNGIFGNSGPQSEQSPRAKGTTAGIALAAFGGAAAYGAAMFLIARRYKQRNMRRMRGNSESSLPESRFMAEGGDAGVHTEASAHFHPHDSESRGSGRTRNSGVNNQNISGPVMAENSLGWS